MQENMLDECRRRMLEVDQLNRNLHWEVAELREEQPAADGASHSHDSRLLEQVSRLRSELDRCMATSQHNEHFATMVQAERDAQWMACRSEIELLNNELCRGQLIFTRLSNQHSDAMKTIESLLTQSKMQEQSADESKATLSGAEWQGLKPRALAYEPMAWAYRCDGKARDRDGGEGRNYQKAEDAES